MKEIEYQYIPCSLYLIFSYTKAKIPASKIGKKENCYSYNFVKIYLK